MAKHIACVLWSLTALAAAFAPPTRTNACGRASVVRLPPAPSTDVSRHVAIRASEDDEAEPFFADPPPAPATNDSSDDDDVPISQLQAQATEAKDDDSDDDVPIGKMAPKPSKKKTGSRRGGADAKAARARRTKKAEEARSRVYMQIRYSWVGHFLDLSSKGLDWLLGPTKFMRRVL